MDKYMLTIMVTFEQEYAIQKLFGRHGWEYSKITDEISPKKENSVEKVSSEPQPPVNQQSTVKKTVTVPSSTSKIVTSNNDKVTKTAAVKILVISDVKNKLDNSISSEADPLGDDDHDEEGDEDDDYGGDTDTEHAEQSLESLGIVVKEEVDSEDDKTCDNHADNVSSSASNVKISGKGKRVAQTKVVTSNRKKRKLATCTVTSAEAEENVDKGEREVKLEQLPAEDQDIDDPLAVLETLPDIEHLSKVVSSETHDVETFLTGPSDIDDSGYSFTLAAYFCKDCQYTFPEEKYFTVHKRSGKCVFQCQFCDKKYTFKTFSSYQEHLKQHSRDWLEVSIKDEVIVHSEQDTNENSKVSCTVLTSRSDKNTPVQPLRSQNSKSDTSVQPSRSQNSKSDTSVQPSRSQDSKSNEGRSSSSVESKQKKRIYCNICTYSTMLAYNMHRHQKSVHEERQWKCDKCSKTFKEIYYLRQHQRCVHENMKLLCEHCSKEFNSKQVLRRHILVKHFGKPKYECNVCDKKFFEIWSYQGHMNKHSNARPYACLFCNKAFGYKSCLQRHSLSCSGQNLEKCKCTLCGKQLKSTASLKQHTKGVHGPKDLACVCGEQFSWNCSLARHKKSCKVLKN